MKGRHAESSATPLNVSVSDLCLDYGKQTVLHNISFKLTGNKIYGLLGRNGAGKTSLLSILASFREASRGSIAINGETPFENASIMQQVALFYNKDYKDESDNLKAMLQDMQNYRPRFDMAYAEYLAGLFKLDAKKPVKQLSRGLQAVVSVVLGLACRAPLTIFDEVYLGMDAPSRALFYQELIKDQEKHPRMILLSTHLVSEMDYLFDEVMILDQGELLLHEDTESFVSRGATITGKGAVVDDFVRSMNPIHAQQLGDTKSVMVYGKLSDEKRSEARGLGLDVAPVSLQELFIHLTEERQQ